MSPRRPSSYHYYTPTTHTHSYTLITCSVLFSTPEEEHSNECVNCCLTYDTEYRKLLKFCLLSLQQAVTTYPLHLSFYNNPNHCTTQANGNNDNSEQYNSIFVVVEGNIYLFTGFVQFLRRRRTPRHHHLFLLLSCLTSYTHFTHMMGDKGGQERWLHG